MSATSTTELPANVMTAINGGHSSVVATIDAEGRPATTLMTWVIAKDPHRLALCVDTRSRSYKNLVARPWIAIEILADNVTYGVQGTAHVAKELMEAPPFPCAAFIVTIDEVRDHSNPGTTFRGPSYIFHEEKKHRAEFEQRVYDELRAVP